MRAAASVILALMTGAGVYGASSLDASVRLTPTILAIAPGETSTSVTVHNASSTDVLFEAQAFAWHNERNGNLQMVPTEDLVVFPTRFAVAAGGERRLRIGTRLTQPSVERAYRVIVEQAATPGQPSPGLSFRLRFSLPLFVEPARRTASVELTPPVVAGGQVRFSLSNTGARHLLPKHVTIEGHNAQGAVLWQRPLSIWYVLPGEVRDYSAALSAAECAAPLRRLAVKVEFVQSEKLALEETADVSPPCAGR
jgi:fimbrial chaperone protein